MVQGDGVSTIDIEDAVLIVAAEDHRVSAGAVNGQVLVDDDLAARERDGPRYAEKGRVESYRTIVGAIRDGITERARAAIVGVIDRGGAIKRFVRAYVGPAAHRTKNA